MFILFFSIFILFFTIYSNIAIGTIAFLILVVTIWLYGTIKKTDISKTIMLVGVGFLLAGSSVLFYNYRYGNIEIEKIFIGTGQIVDNLSMGKYIFENNKGKYSLSSKKNHEIGDIIRLVGNKANTDTTGSFDYAKRLKMKGLHGALYENNSILLVSLAPLDKGGGPERRGIYKGLGWVGKLKTTLQNSVKDSYGTGKIAGLTLGMLIGDKSSIPASDYQTFIDSGLVHLIAVSGGNIIMIVVFLSFILMFLPFYVRNFVILISIILYGFLCGMDSSVFRAVIMGGLGMIALFFGKEISIRRSISIAFLLMLFINPYFLVYDVGFIFSFSAIIGLIYFSKKIKAKFGIGYVRNNYLSPSIGATIGIFPSMIFFMGKINLIGTIGNLLVLPIVPIVMIYGFISTILYRLFPRSGFLLIQQRLVSYIYRVSKITSQFGLYMNVEGDWIKRLILGFAIMRFIYKRFQTPKTIPNQEKSTSTKIQKSSFSSHILPNLTT